MDDELENLKARFGVKGIQELAKLDGMGMNLLYRLYLVSSIASNLKQFNDQLGEEFYTSQTKQINYLMKDIDKFTRAFQNKRGEI